MPFSNFFLNASIYQLFDLHLHQLFDYNKSLICFQTSDFVFVCLNSFSNRNSDFFVRLIKFSSFSKIILLFSINLILS